MYRNYFRYSCSAYTFEGCNYPAYLKTHYNRAIATNATIKHPYSCCKGRKNCSICSVDKKNTAQAFRRENKRELIETVKKFNTE